MWDVNYDLWVKQGWITTSFIWTMWDVNLEEAPACIKGAKFHMDYVGCKLHFIIMPTFCVCGFIWTMWDVNFSKQSLYNSFAEFHMDYVGCK